MQSSNLTIGIHIQKATPGWSRTSACYSRLPVLFLEIKEEYILINNISSNHMRIISPASRSMISSERYVWVGPNFHSLNAFFSAIQSASDLPQVCTQLSCLYLFLPKWQPTAVRAPPSQIKPWVAKTKMPLGLLSTALVRRTKQALGFRIPVCLMCSFVVQKTEKLFVLSYQPNNRLFT